MANIFLSVIEPALRQSGKLIISQYGSLVASTVKSDPSQIVTAVDIASEKLIIDRISQHFPTHSILAEESGFLNRKSDYLWIIDPIDGTSNFAQGLPWFGVMIAVLKDWQVQASGIYLPVTDQLYVAALGKGAYRNNERVTVVEDSDLKHMLLSYCVDSSSDENQIAKQTRVFSRLVSRVRNIRSTNSAVDYAYAAEGRLGGLISFTNKIWDVAAVSLLATEAGTVVTDHNGNELSFEVDEYTYTRNYTLIISTRKNHLRLLTLLK